MIVRYMPCLLPSLFITVIAHCTKISKLTHNNKNSPKKLRRYCKILLVSFYVNFNLGRIYGELHGFINMEEVKLMKTDCCG